MVHRLIALILLTLLTTLALHANIRFTIRYQDKNIYYSGDEIKIKLTLLNPFTDNTGDATFYLADDPRQSFGFDLRDLMGKPQPLAEKFLNALDKGGAYRIVHLAPGQELSLTVTLNNWSAQIEPGQYQLNAYFFPQLRGSMEEDVSLAETRLDLTVMPPRDRPWRDALEQDIREALMDRDLDPWNVVRETLEKRQEGQYNRALLYLDLDSLSTTLRDSPPADLLEKDFLNGSWKSLTGFEHPTTAVSLISSQVYPQEALVTLEASYQPYGERFDKKIRFYLHQKQGYWQIRRVESLTGNQIDSMLYARTDLDPHEVVEELLQAIKRGDWDIALRYLHVDELTRNLPEYRDRWNSLSAVEQERAVLDYRKSLIAGTWSLEEQPLRNLTQWSLHDVNYGLREGSVSIIATTIFETANGPFSQRSLYTFRLVKTAEPEQRWWVIRYDTVLLREK